MLVLSSQPEAVGGALVVLAGSAVNQGGRASSLTAPNGPSQQEAMRQAQGSAGLAPWQVAGLQLHGTGTALGDPIEVGAACGLLLEAQQVQRQRHGKRPLMLLASKSMLGHSEPASGMMGLARLSQVGGAAALEQLACR